MRRLLRRAESWGLWVEWAPLGDQRGFYEHDARTITLNSQMTEPLLRSTLAHELGHAFHCHTAPPSSAHRERQEREANRYAAALLVTDPSYAAAERLHGPHIGAIAVELGVATYIVETWQQVRRLDPTFRRSA